MTMNRFSRTLVLAGMAALGAIPLTVAAEAPPPPATVPDRAQLERRLESVKTLLEKSSAAKQIESSGDANALAQRAKALEMWNEAKKAFDAGDLAQTQKLLLEAPKIMFSAARQAAPEEVHRDKAKADYVNRRESVKALMVAQKRVSTEKGGVAGAEETARNVDKLLVEAEKHAAEGKFDKARSVADEAYLLAKASVGQMRSGDTLVRALNFANKEEEYKYELDRNDSLQMLYKVLIEQKGNSNPMVVAQVKKAQDLRVEAEAAAARKDHVGGIKLLEESTGQLVRAIRSAGIFIPG
jgi:hypothetical protein